MYGSAGTMITELAVMTLGGYAKIFHTPAFVSAVASVERKVVNAVAITRPLNSGSYTGQ